MPAASRRLARTLAALPKHPRGSATRALRRLAIARTGRRSSTRARASDTPWAGVPDPTPPGGARRTAGPSLFEGGADGPANLLRGIPVNRPETLRDSARTLRMRVLRSHPV